VEFIEGVARIAHHLDTSRLKDFFPNFKPKNPQQLDKKIESLCFILFERNLSPKAFEVVFKRY
jgi:hypothetical protein